MKETLSAVLARSSIGVIAIALAAPALAHAADGRRQQPATTADRRQSPPRAIPRPQPRMNNPPRISSSPARRSAARRRPARRFSPRLPKRLPSAARPTAMNSFAVAPGFHMFQSLPALGGGAAGLVAVSRLPFQPVSLRNLPNVQHRRMPTLTLIDGHRVVPMGTNALGGQGVDSSGFRLRRCSGPK